MAKKPAPPASPPPAAEPDPPVGPPPPYTDYDPRSAAAATPPAPAPAGKKRGRKPRPKDASDKAACITWFLRKHGNNDWDELIELLKTAWPDDTPPGWETEANKALFAEIHGKLFGGKKRGPKRKTKTLAAGEKPADAKNMTACIRWVLETHGELGWIDTVRKLEENWPEKVNGVHWHSTHIKPLYMAVLRKLWPEIYKSENRDKPMGFPTASHPPTGVSATVARVQELAGAVGWDELASLVTLLKPKS